MSAGELARAAESESETNVARISAAWFPDHLISPGMSPWTSATGGPEGARREESWRAPHASGRPRRASDSATARGVRARHSRTPAPFSSSSHSVTSVTLPSDASWSTGRSVCWL